MEDLLLFSLLFHDRNDGQLGAEAFFASRILPFTTNQLRAAGVGGGAVNKQTPAKTNFPTLTPDAAISTNHYTMTVIYPSPCVHVTGESSTVQAVFSVGGAVVYRLLLIFLYISKRVALIKAVVVVSEVVGCSNPNKASYDSIAFVTQRKSRFAGDN